MINYRNETPAYKDVCGTKKFQYSTRPMIMNACPAAQAWVFCIEGDRHRRLKEDTIAVGFKTLMMF